MHIYVYSFIGQQISFTGLQHIVKLYSDLRFCLDEQLGISTDLLYPAKLQSYWLE